MNTALLVIIQNKYEYKKKRASGGGVRDQHRLTNVLWSSHNLSELPVAADHPGQTKVHDLDVPQRRAAGQQDVLRLTGQCSAC